MRAGGTLPPTVLSPAPAAPTDNPTSIGSGDAGAGGQDGAMGAGPASNPGEKPSGRRARPRYATLLTEDQRLRATSTLDGRSGHPGARTPAGGDQNGASCRGVR